MQYYPGRRNKEDILSGVSKSYNKARVKARSTVLIDYADGSKALRYHDTDVVTFLPNGDVVLNSGGFRTVTTKERINEYATGIKLYQEKGVWYLNSNKEKDVVFYDGITFDKDGKLLTKRVDCDYKKINQVKRQISSYVKLLDEMESIPFPSNGDCWFCLFTNESGKSWGDLSDNTHLENHLEEGYIHGSIIVNAMREKGYTDNQIGIHYHMGLKDTMKRALRRYLMRRLLPDVSCK